MSQDILKEYAEKILEIQGNAENLPTKEELSLIARELGLTDEKIDNYVEQHIKRGKNFLENDCWDEAIEELEQAIKLSPLNEDLLYYLAKAYACRWENTGDENSNKKAKLLVSRCIKLNADYKASYSLLSKLKMPIKKPGIASMNGVKPGYIILGIIIGLLVFFFVSRFLNSKSSTDNPSIDGSSPAQYLSSDTDDYISGTNKYNPDVELLENNNSEGLTLSVQSSLLTIYDDSYSYELNADLYVDKYEIDTIQVRMDWFNGSGEIVFTEFINLMEDYEPTLRPGDIYAIDHLVYEENTAPDVAKVLFTIELIENQLAPENYSDAKLMPFEWIPNESESFNIELYERENRITDGFNTQYHYLTLAVKNTGNRVIRELTFKIDWFDKSGKLIKTTNNLFVMSSRPVFKPGQIKLIREICSFDDDEIMFDTFKVFVSEIN